MNKSELNGNEIAIIGMAGRFPKSANIYEFWDNIINGRECISFFTDEELIEEGIELNYIKNKDYIKAKGVIDNIDLFDASFFDINPKEAELMDPQHRLLLECAWEALENAGYDAERYEGAIGVYAGKSMSSYLFLNVYPHIKKILAAGNLQAAIGNDKDSITSTISYRLNLKGPSINVQSSSSTSLAAVAIACQSLLTYQCDMALAGGITVGPPVKSGYLYDVGGIMSSDGHCRAFDAKSSGFVPGNGYGLVVLKRLDEAIRDNDHIWAVIKGFGVNNDGSEKVSYTAPSVDAQANVIVTAQIAANVNPERISYIEAHGTGTALGDPIEVKALTQAFRYQTDKKKFCALGSVKPNIGHLDSAAGIAGLIKVVLSLYNKKIPPLINFDTPNPEIDFENSPFYVNTSAKYWNDFNGSRIAGITSLGMGGTNVHIIVEENLHNPSSGNSREWNILMISAKTPYSLEGNTNNLVNYLKDEKVSNIADVAYTLAMGRKHFSYRRVVVCRDVKDAVESLSSFDSHKVISTVCSFDERQVCFMFTGQGAQYINMARGIYEAEQVFKEVFDRCCEIVKEVIDVDLCRLLYKDYYEDGEQAVIDQTYITQPLLFALEYSMASLLMNWGIKPVAMIGHSLGEYVAATISGVFSLEEALKLVCLRARMMFNMPQGGMLAVALEEKEALKFLQDGVSIAAINAPKLCVLSGEFESLSHIEKRLNDSNIFCTRLKTSHAFHSLMMKGVAEEYAELIKSVSLKKPSIPFISCVTGDWIKENEAINPDYWVKHILEPVRFKEGLEKLLENDSRVLLEIGPGNTLCKFVRQSTVYKEDMVVIPTIRSCNQTDNDCKFLANALAELWANGVKVDWAKYYENEVRRRIPLPTYAFERKSYWIKGEDAGDTIQNCENVYNSDKSEPLVCQKQSEKTYHDRPNQDVEYVPPENEVQQNVVNILEDLLGIKPIGIKDNFFDIGGHSLLATQVLSRIREIYNTRFSLNVLFSNPTVEQISHLILSSRQNSMNEVDDLLSEIVGMSEDELNKVLDD